MGRKSVRRLNTYELIGTSIHWVLSVDSLDMHDVRAFLEHLEFISVTANHNDFVDSTHVEYNIAIRKLAESVGFEASSQKHAKSHILDAFLKEYLTNIKLVFVETKNSVVQKMYIGMV